MDRPRELADQSRVASKALTALLCCRTLLLSLSVPNLPFRQRCPFIDCLRGGHSRQGSKGKSLLFLGTIVKPLVHKTHHIGTLNRRVGGRSRPGSEKIVFLLRQGPYVSQASPKLTKKLKMILNFILLLPPPSKL